MPTSRNASALRKPAGDEKIPVGILAYLRAQSQAGVYDLVLAELARSGITKATLARRLGLSAAAVSKLLEGPRNWTVGTVSDLLFAISGAMLSTSARHVADEPAGHVPPPAWLSGPTRESKARAGLPGSIRSPASAGRRTERIARPVPSDASPRSAKRSRAAVKKQAS